MIRLLGEERLLLPSLISSALEANERVKYLLALVQAARTAADGATRIGNLRDERLAAGVRDAALDAVVEGSARVEDGRYRIPGAGELAHRAVAEVDRMLAPLRAAGVRAAATLDERRQAVAATLPAAGDLLRPEDIVRLCAGPGERGDSLHRVVMDAHRHLNELAAEAAPESISGARAYDLDPAQRALVQALMRGIHATERLKLGHPGLDTIATTTHDGLVIENDLGTTDAHVLVLRVIGRAVTITYTDVHLERALFFQDLLAPWPVSWEDTRSRAAKGFEEGLFHLVSGRFESGSDEELQRFLERLGSRLVFIIDWNRARKRLRRLVGNRAAIGLLRWAAEEDVGHIPFLVAGGDGLVYAALQFAGAPEARAGVSLRDVLGVPAARRYLQTLLRICSEQLLAGRSVSLISDQAAAELIGYLRSARQEIQELALRHAELDVELAEAARDSIEQAILGEMERCRATAARAQATERDADTLVTEARTEATRAPDQSELLDLVQASDDIADCAEEAAFYATLLPALPAEDAVAPQVRRIARLVLTAAREYLRAVQLSTELHRGGPRDDMDAFLAAAHGAIETEREVDAAQRAVHEVLAADARRPHTVLFVVNELTRALEEASDALMHCAHLLREQTLGRVVRSEGGYQWREAAPAPPAHGRAGRSDHVYVVGGSSAPVPAATAIGAKAHGLARLVRAGMRVPDAAVLTTSLWHASRGGAEAGTAVSEAVAAAVDAIASRTGLRFGSRRRPLLVSVRSGAPVSMPGMLETVLNVGLCDATVGGLVAQTGNPKLVWDSYRRLIESFAAVIHGVAHDPFDQALRDRLRADGADSPRELSARALRELAADDRRLFAELVGEEFPQDPEAQLLAAVRAVLSSWDAPKARAYRRLHDIPETSGTAVILQRMVFGNAGGISGAGVGFTRDPALGDRRMYLDFMFDAQGEDVVAGRQTVTGVGELALASPDLIAELEQVCRRLEAELRDAQEFELTVQDGQLFLLQTRTAKRTPWAALRIAVDQVDEGLISPAQGLKRLAGLDLNSITRRRVDAGQAGEALARAVPAGTGVAIGPIALDGAAAERQAAAGTAPVLVRAESVTDDVAAVGVSAGVLTRSGSRTSHAAVVARELGIPCLVGCDALELDPAARTIRLGGRMLAEGETVCLDGDSGLVYLGAPRVTEERPTEALDQVESWRQTLSRSAGSSRP